jgi:signal transduction histidine kinase
VKKTKILIVEDEAIIAKDLQLQLESMGFAVPSLAATGADAVLKAGQFSPDLILMDIMLSDEMDGIEAAGQIRTRYGIPVVYMTAHSEKEVLERSKATEPYGYLIKPVSNRNLQATIEMSVHRSELEKNSIKNPVQPNGPPDKKTVEMNSAITFLREEISSRRRAEELLENEKYKLQAIVDTMEYGLTIQDRNYNIIYQNSILKNTFGGLGEKCYEIYEGNKTVCSNCPVEMAYRDGRSHTSERRVTMPSGDTGYWENTANPIRNASGEIVACLEIARNITHHKKLEKTVLEIADKEQMRIGQDLHDDLGQLLTGLSYKTKVLEERLQQNSSKDALYASEISELVNHAKQQVKHMIKGMLPLETDENALISALEELAVNTRKIFSVPCELIHGKHISIHNEAAVMHLYRIAKEAVTNAVKHSTPANIEISLSENNGNVKLAIKDDGTGIQEADKRKTGMGLNIMNYRAAMIGASLEILSENGRGTSVICTYTENGESPD